MVRQPYLKKGSWSRDEDQKLIAYITRYGIWNWNEMPRFAVENNNSASSPTETKSSVEENSSDADLENNNSASSPTETKSSVEENSSDADSSMMLGSDLSVAVDDHYSMAMDNYLVSYWEIQSFLEQPQMIEGLDCEAISQNSQQWHSHHQQYYDPLHDFWVNPLI
ncbi:hypothetical protein GOBAR_DD17203 [Gossypium barbadense]|nr:hypothetical protein GOBAR_DD17203 [Gossypium barbadense]